MKNKKEKTISTIINILVAIVFCWGAYVLVAMLVTPY